MREVTKGRGLPRRVDKLRLLDKLKLLYKLSHFGHNSTPKARNPTIFCMREVIYIFYDLETVSGPGEP